MGLADKLAKWNISSNMGILNVGLADIKGNSLDDPENTVCSIQIVPNTDGSAVEESEPTNDYFALQENAIANSEEAVKLYEETIEDTVFTVPALSVGISEKLSALLADQRTESLYKLSRADFYKQAAEETQTNYVCRRQTTAITSALIDSVTKTIAEVEEQSSGS